MKKILLIIQLMLLTITITSKSDWSAGNFYQSRGETWTDWKTVFIGYDYYGNASYKTYCRKTKWYSEYREGYYNTWTEYGWLSCWYKGYQWKCTWSGWYICY